MLIISKKDYVNNFIKSIFIRTIFVILAILIISNMFIDNRIFVNYKYNYEDDYKNCIKELPRNLDCKANKVSFVIVNKD